MSGNQPLISIKAQAGEFARQHLLDLEWQVEQADETGFEFKLFFQ